MISEVLALTKVEAREAGSDGTSVFRIRLPDDTPLDLRVLWVGEGWPNDLHRTLPPQILSSWPSDLVVVARRLSPGSLELLTDVGANWIDESGQARVVMPGLYVLRQELEAKTKVSRFSWSPSSMAVAEALLRRSWPEGIRTTELATRIEWSPPQVSQVLSAFDARGWTVKFGAQRGPSARRELADPDGLLGAWAAAIADEDREVREAHRTIREPARFLREELAPLLNETVRWALTGWAASEEAAPFLTSMPSVQIYIHDAEFNGALTEAMGRAGLRDVGEGGRIEFIAAPPSVMAMSESRGGLSVASPPRIYADLLSKGGRGQDAAAHYKQEVIDPTFHPRVSGSPPGGLREWEAGCRARLEARARHEGGPNEYGRLYGHGTWSSSYRLLGAQDTLGLPQFMGVLREVAGRETGWPPWWTPDDAEARPKPIDGMIECWMNGGVFRDGAHGDYWRADPQGRLCLIRGYQEDAASAVSPGEVIDLTLPIWRTGECLLHAERLAQRLGATRIQFMMRWEGLGNRRLASFASPDRVLPGIYESTQESATSYVEIDASRVVSSLDDVVLDVVEPLYSGFDFYEVPRTLVAEELKKMRRGV